MNDAKERLLDAWRGEVRARAQYEILAQRVRDPKRANIIRQIADAEGRHRERVEKRLGELGISLPDAESARLSWLQRLQAELAPISVVIARMEAAEQSEIDDRYHRPTGDPQTDEVLSAIRVEEQGHSRSLDELQAAHATDINKPSGVQSRLDRILHRETWHRTGAGWISGAIYGANDGLAAVFGIAVAVEPAATLLAPFRTPSRPEPDRAEGATGHIFVVRGNVCRRLPRTQDFARQQFVVSGNNSATGPQQGRALSPASAVPGAWWRAAGPGPVRPVRPCRCRAAARRAARR